MTGRRTSQHLSFTLWLLVLLGGLGCTINLEPDQDSDGYPLRRDCDDRDDTVHPDATEVCDGRDNDCDGLSDDADPDTRLEDATAWYADHDGDGYGDPTNPTRACALPAGFVVNAGDCDDADPALRPGATELCDGLDNDCDGLIDDDDTDSIPEGVQPWYADADGDLYGDGTSIRLACVQPDGYVTLWSGLLDCDDADAAVHPGAIEACDGLDNDCDGQVDDDTAQVVLWYPDIDLDGHGDEARSVLACPGPEGWVQQGDDCDDHDPTVYRGALEVCDAVDNDCDGQRDEGLTRTFYPDADGDGYGTQTGAITDCAMPAGYAAQSGDCDDTSASSWPGAPVLCDGRDDDCDGRIDAASTLYFRDQDGDGFGDVAVTSCQLQDGYTATRGDCDDLDPATHAGADDPPDDGFDQDCGGTEDPEPHVGFTTRSTPSIQAALDAAAGGTTVWVGPGRYLEQDITFRGKVVTLISSHGAAQTVVDVNRVANRSGFLFRFGEGAATVLDGFGVTGADGGLYGAAVYIVGSSPTLIGCRIFGNYVIGTGNGAGMYLKWSYSVVRDCTFDNNNVDYGGGAVYMESSSPVFERCRFERNSAEWGGAMYVLSSKPVIRASVIDSNVAWSSGGGLYLYRASADLRGLELTNNGGGAIFASFDGSTLRQSRIVGNDYWGVFSTESSTTRIDSSAVLDNRGAGLILGTGTYQVANSVIAGNSSSTDGGGIYLYGGQAVFTHTRVTGNEAARDGGALYLKEGGATFDHCVLTGNTAQAGAGGLTAAGDAATSIALRDTIVAYNSGYNLSLDETTVLDATWSVFYHPDGLDVIGAQTPPDASNLWIEPGFLGYDADGRPRDFHLASDSPLVDAGSPTVRDPDGSTGDPGIYGGPGGDDRDEDGDGFPAYFWPGAYRQSPAGVDPTFYDCDDADAALPAGGKGCD